MPNETFETPSDVSTPGSSDLIRRMPSIVSTADGRHSSSPVVSVNVSASKISSCGIHPVLAADEVVDSLGDLELALARLAHADLVDRQRDQRGAVGHRDRRDAVELVAPGLEVDRVDDRAARDLLERDLDHLGLGRIYLDRGRLRERDLLRHEPHLLVLVLALGQRDAEVERVGAALDLVLGDGDEAVVVVGQQHLLGLARALRVDALADERRRRVLGERRRGHHRGHVRRARRGARGGPAAADAVDDRADVVGRGAAAAADDRDAVAVDELAEGVRERVGALREDRLAVRALVRDAGVRDALDRHRRVLAEEADGVAHVLGAGRAVQADHVDRERLERREHGGDVGAEQHLAAVRQQGHGGLDRHGPAGLCERLARTEDGGLDLEDVLRRLDEKQVRAAVDEPLRLLGEDGDELAEADLPERRVVRCGQVAGRADRTGDEALLADRRTGDLGGLEVDLVGVLAQAPLVELDPRGLEGVGLDDLRARLHHRLVKVRDHVGTVEHERLVGAPGELVVVLEREVELLQRGAHAAVEDDDAVAGGGKVVAHPMGC